MFLNCVFWQKWFSLFLWFLGSLIKNGQLMHQSASCAHAPLRATAGHLPALSFPGVGHLPILRCPGAGHLPTPGLFPSWWHARGFLSKYNNTEDFTGKTSMLAHLTRTGKKACSRFYACISSLLIKPELHGEIGSYRRESTFFSESLNWIKFQLVLFEENPFILIKLLDISNI